MRRSFAADEGRCSESRQAEDLVTGLKPTDSVGASLMRPFLRRSPIKTIKLKARHGPRNANAPAQCIRHIGAPSTGARANGGRFAAPVLIIKCPYFRIVGTRQGALIFSEIRPRNRNLRRRQAAQTKLSLHTVDAFRVG